MTTVAITLAVFTTFYLILFYGMVVMAKYVKNLHDRVTVFYNEIRKE